MSDSERVVPWFECEDGYPTEASIERLRAEEFDFYVAPRFWLHDFEAICSGIGTCMVKRTEGDDGFGRPVTTVEFHTGGWSGAEEFIDAVLSKFWLARYHTKWERGGHFWFEIPKNHILLKPEKQTQSTS